MVLQEAGKGELINNKNMQVNAGLPPLDENAEDWSWFEFWPLWFFYFPVVIYWIALGIRYRNLGLPMLANPNIELGGMVGESKSQVLNQAGPLARKYILPYVALKHEAGVAPEEAAGKALTEARSQGLQLPLVVKPDLGCRGLAVRVLHAEKDLIDYLQVYPDEQLYLLQQLAPWQAEAGVFYVRKPGQDSGKVVSITLKYIPTVVGDGKATFEQLLNAHPRTRKMRSAYLNKNGVKAQGIPSIGEEVALTFSGSHCRGSIFRNGNEYICKELTAAIDKVMQDFPEFYYGRLDIKFKDLESLQRGENFCVIEINGASSEATHIWDSRTRIREVFATLFWQYRNLFEIGHELRKQGRRAPTVVQLIKAWLRALRNSANYPLGE